MHAVSRNRHRSVGELTVFESNPTGQ